MGWLVEEAQSSADATAQVSSTSPLSAKRPKLAPPATDDSSVMNALGPLLNAGISHSLSSTVAGEVKRYLAQHPRQLLHRQLIGGVKMDSAFLASRVAITARF